MALTWSDSLAGFDWSELEALYRLAPLGNKSAAGLQMVFTNSRYRVFAFEDGRLVGAGRALADGADCSYICDVAVMLTAMAIFENQAQAIENGYVSED